MYDYNDTIAALHSTYSPAHKGNTLLFYSQYPNVSMYKTSIMGIEEVGLSIAMA